MYSAFSLYEWLQCVVVLQCVAVSCPLPCWMNDASIPLDSCMNRCNRLQCVAVCCVAVCCCESSLHLFRLILA